jgi:DNA-binding NarL/FixJ family response regulator
MNSEIKIVIADDHQLILDELKKLLANNSAVKIMGTYTNGEDLKEAIKQHKPNLVITDINMPLINGIEICEWAKKVFPTIKIVLISMFYSQSIINKIIAIKADGYLIKNTTKQEIEKCIISVIAGEKYFHKNNTFISNSDESFLFPSNYLTNNELDVLKFMTAGFTNSEIAEKLSMAETTIVSIRAIIYKKLNTSSLADLVSFAQNLGVIDKQ